jgi:phosphatidylserine/phosphatidylglycerophosphate/cardiolipin synthase-like enzyme
VDAGKIRANELKTSNAAPVAPTRAEEAPSAKLRGDRYVAARQRQAAFEQLSPIQKGWKGLKMGLGMMPAMFKGMVSHPKALVQAFTAPYLHPVQSWKDATKAFNASKKQGPIEAALTAVKSHGGLVSAWMLPVSLALAPVTGGASLIAAGASLLGTAGLAANGASLVKNTVDAASADTEGELKQQAKEIAADGAGLATAAATAGAAKGAQKLVGAVREARDPFTRAQKAWANGEADGVTGNSRIGKAVNKAVANADETTVGRNKIFTKGSVEEVWINDLDGENECMQRLAHDIRTGTSKEAILQTFCVYGDSTAADDVFKAVAERQKVDPDFRLILMHTGDSDKLPMPIYSYKVQDALAKYGAKAYVGEYVGGLSSKINHSKTYLLDRHTAIFGGNNIQAAPEQDMLIKAKGEVVGSFLDDARSAWKESKRTYYFDGKTLHEGVDCPALFEDMPVDPVKARPTRPQVPMTMLSKRANANSQANAGILTAMDASQKYVKIKTPNLNEKEVLERAVTLAKQGKKVQLLVSRDHNAVKSVFSGGTNRQTVRRLYDSLPPELRENIEIRWHSPDGKTVRKSHTKYVGVDGEWAYIGSQNMDKQSFGPSREIGVGIDDAQTVQEMEAEIFDKDWATGVVAERTSPWHDITEQVPGLKRFHKPID